jgi:hypothetical protein
MGLKNHASGIEAVVAQVASLLVDGEDPHDFRAGVWRRRALWHDSKGLSGEGCVWDGCCRCDSREGDSLCLLFNCARPRRGEHSTSPRWTLTAYPSLMQKLTFHRGSRFIRGGRAISPCWVVDSSIPLHQHSARLCCSKAPVLIVHMAATKIKANSFPQHDLSMSLRASVPLGG